MAIEKSLTFRTWHRDIGGDFTLAYPAEIEEWITALRRRLADPATRGSITNEPDLDALEFLIRRLEHQAAAILEAAGHDPDPHELWWEEDSSLGIRLASAKAVIIGARNLRDSIAENDLQQALIDMFIVATSAVRGDLFEQAMLGVAEHRKKRRGGAASKVARGIMEWTSRFVAEHPKATAEGVWAAVPEGPEEIQINGFALYRDGDHLVQVADHDGKERAITLSTFRKYVTTARKTANSQ